MGRTPGHGKRPIAAIWCLKPGSFVRTASNPLGRVLIWFSMLVLAIDTALDACAAGVLDTKAGRLIAQESLPMKRGHAEALMPLIARVMNAADVALRRWTASP